MTADHQHSGQILSPTPPSLDDLLRRTDEEPESLLGSLTHEQVAFTLRELVYRLQAADWERRLEDARAPDLRDVFAQFASPGELIAALERCEIIPVMTAHPSELRSRPVIDILAQVDATTSRREIESALAAIGTPVKIQRPSIHEEIEAFASFLEATLFPALYHLVLRIQDAAEACFGEVDAPLPLPITFHSWIGADRDGNPNVRAEVTAEIGARLRRAALHCYATWCAERLNNLHADIAPDACNALLGLQAAVRDDRADLDIASCVNEVLIAARRENQPTLQRHAGVLLRIAEKIGVHFMPLEWRDNSVVILDAYEETHAAENVSGDHFRAATSDLLKSLRVLAQLRRDNGPSAVAALIISNCEDIGAVRALTALATACGVFEKGGPWHGPHALPIVPLFESIDALERSGSLSAELLALQRLQQHADPQQPLEIMLGYSDAAKDGGRLMGDVAIRRAQREIADQCRAVGRVAAIFHGRGGSDARGVIDTMDAFIDQAAALPGYLKQTEQGEIVANRYGHPKLAAATLDLWIVAGLRSLNTATMLQPEIEAMCERLAVDAFHAYRELRDDPRFLEHVLALTPLAAVCIMPLSSRPAARVDAQGRMEITLQRLRAIPLNIAFNVAGMPITSWYGTGTALAREIAAHGAEGVRSAWHADARVRLSFERAARSLAQTDLRRVKMRMHRLGHDAHQAFLSALLQEAARLKKSLAEIGVHASSTEHSRDEERFVDACTVELERREAAGVAIPNETKFLAIAARVALLGASG